MLTSAVLYAITYFPGLRYHGTWLYFRLTHIFHLDILIFFALYFKASFNIWRKTTHYLLRTNQIVLKSCTQYHCHIICKFVRDLSLRWVLQKYPKHPEKVESLMRHINVLSSALYLTSSLSYVCHYMLLDAWCCNQRDVPLLLTWIIFSSRMDK